MSNNNRKLLPALALSVMALLAIVSSAIANLPDTDHLISQKGKQFEPQDVSLHSGDQVTIVNDDGNFVHHAYVEDDEFTYDSGDIEPGARAVITFPKEGDFTVLCGIHPNMRLAVHVR